MRWKERKKKKKQDQLSCPSDTAGVYPATICGSVLMTVKPFPFPHPMHCSFFIWQANPRGFSVTRE